jgi:hypothetical protein
VQAVYGKLKGIEPEVCNGLVRATSGELTRQLDKAGLRKKDVIPGYHTYVIDGKSINATEHRLKETRRDSRAPLPGRLIGILDTRYQLFVDVETELNAHRCERKILEPMCPRLEPGALYLADRNFSDGQVLMSILEADAFFIIRRHKACPSWREIPGNVPKSCRTTDSRGGAVTEREVEIQLANGTWFPVRLITVTLASPTRDGERVLNILTNLPVNVSAQRVSDAYAERWTIETCLGHLARALNAEINTLCYPGAALLCFSLALVLFNVMSAIKAFIDQRATQLNPQKPLEASFYYMADEISDYHPTIKLFFPAGYWRRFERMSSNEFHKWLVKLASGARLKRYAKNPRGPKKPPPKRRFTGARHVATQKLLDARK